ncbi:hypothetical protein [Roseiarcus fermentans]|uniref:hypothetical protein n=1 Tax=Roseiarcus fermentans TaxID=1473586 RepID=UPI000DE8DC7E|nr:hypothetical protein [Roseiarcus fermentans]
MDDLVFVRIALPRKMVLPTPQSADAVYIRTCRGGVLQIPRPLLKTDAAGAPAETHAVFEARVPRHISAAFRALFAEIFRSAVA